MQEGNWVLMQTMMTIMMVVVAVAAKRKEIVKRRDETHVNGMAQLITSIQSNEIAFTDFPCLTMAHHAAMV